MKKLIRLSLFSIVTVCAVITAQVSVGFAAVEMFLGSALLSGHVPGYSFAITLTTAEIVADFFEAFRKLIPAINYFSTDFSNAEAKFNQQIIAHVGALPVAVTHTTYFGSPVSARTLLSDVPITMDTWKDVVLKFQAADLVADRSTKYTKTVNSAAYVLAKALIDSVLAKVVAANLSHTVICTQATATAAKLRTFVAQLNLQGAGPMFYGLVKSGFMTGLLSDTNIISGFYWGERQEGTPIMQLKSIQGFQAISEYPDDAAWPALLNALFFDARAVAVASRLPADSLEMARSRGVPIPLKVGVETDEQSGLTILALERLNTDSLDLELCFSVMFGSAVGKQGGSADTIMDQAGLRVTES
jgi:hypothetical protein